MTQISIEISFLFFSVPRKRTGLHRDFYTSDAGVTFGRDDYNRSSIRVRNVLYVETPQTLLERAEAGKSRGDFKDEGSPRRRRRRGIR